MVYNDDNSSASNKLIIIFLIQIIMKIKYLFILVFFASCAGQPTPAAAPPQALPVIQVRSGDAITYIDYPA
jgi:hypothetical protein